MSPVAPRLAAALVLVALGCGRPQPTASDVQLSGEPAAQAEPGADPNRPGLAFFAEWPALPTVVEDVEVADRSEEWNGMWPHAVHHCWGVEYDATYDAVVAAAQTRARTLGYEAEEVQTIFGESWLEIRQADATAKLKADAGSRRPGLSVCFSYPPAEGLALMHQALGNHALGASAHETVRRAALGLSSLSVHWRRDRDLSLQVAGPVSREERAVLENVLEEVGYRETRYKELSRETDGVRTKFTFIDFNDGTMLWNSVAETGPVPAPWTEKVSP